MLFEMSKRARDRYYIYSVPLHHSLLALFRNVLPFPFPFPSSSFCSRAIGCKYDDDVRTEEITTQALVHAYATRCCARWRESQEWDTYMQLSSVDLGPWSFPADLDGCSCWSLHPPAGA